MMPFFARDPKSGNGPGLHMMPFLAIDPELGNRLDIAVTPHLNRVRAQVHKQLWNYLSKESRHG